MRRDVDCSTSWRFASKYEQASGPTRAAHWSNAVDWVASLRKPDGTRGTFSPLTKIPNAVAATSHQ